jgi:hypothetical protein
MQTNETFVPMKKPKALWNQSKKTKPDYSKARKDKQERREGVNNWI